MSILKVARMGHPVLRTKARAVEPAEIATPAFQKLIDDMFETMHEYSGIGLAAPQIHESVRLFVAGLRPSKLIGAMSDDDEMPLVAVINPEITPVPSEAGLIELVDDWEGCLSIPDIRGRVPRPKSIKVRALNREGKRVELTASGLPARVIMHETDHLDGVLFFDRMKSLDTLTFMDEYGRYWRDTEENDELDEQDDEE
jgi:peptide deformylase